MKKTVIILFSLLVVLSVCAQKRHFSPQQFQADLEKYIVREAKLTNKEAAKFLPVYSEMRSKQRALFDEKKRYRHMKPTTDEECKKIIQKSDAIDTQIKNLESRYHNRFLKLLPARKVYDVLKAESRFHRQAFKKMNAGRNKSGK